MATIIYLWSGATGGGTGADWTNAYTTYAAAAADWSTSDEIIYMAQDHQETGSPFAFNSATGDTFTDRVRIFSMERTGTTYAPQTSSYNFQCTGANVDMVFTDYFACYGVYFQIVDGDFNFASGSSFKDCVFEITTPAALRSLTSSDASCYFESCEFTVGGASEYGYWSSSGGNQFVDMTRTGASTATSVLPDGYGDSTIGGIANLTTTPTAATSSNRQESIFHVEGPFDTAPPSGVTSSPNSSATMMLCDASGASYAREWWAQVAGSYELSQPTTAKYRSGGWTDSPSGTALSWKCSTSNALSTQEGTRGWTPSITSRLATTGSKTFTVYGLHDFTNLYAHQVFMQVFYQGTANSLRWHLATTEPDPDQLTTALTSDTSTWTGYTSETKFKLAKTVTVNTAGEWMVRVGFRAYEAGKAIWICPKVEIT